MQGGGQLFKHYIDIEGHSLAEFIYELPFYLGNIMKYAWRAPYKGRIDDTLKLLDYLAMIRFSWAEYKLSDRAIRCLSEISSYDFYSNFDGLERMHRRAIAAIAELILENEGSDSLSIESEKNIVLIVSSLQVELLHN